MSRHQSTVSPGNLLAVLLTQHEALRAQFSAHLATIDPRLYAAQSRALLGWTVEPRLDELKVPLTLICADGDYTPVRRKHDLAAKVPGAKV